MRDYTHLVYLLYDIITIMNCCLFIPTCIYFRNFLFNIYKYDETFCICRKPIKCIEIC